MADDSARLEIVLLDAGTPGPTPHEVMAGAPATPPGQGILPPPGPAPGPTPAPGQTLGPAPGPTPAAGPAPQPVPSSGRSLTLQEIVPVEIVMPLPVPVTGAGGGAATPAEEPGGGGSALGGILAALTAGFRELQGAVRTTAGVLAGLAGNNPLDAVMRAYEGAATAIGKIPVVGQYFEAGMRTATAAVRAFSDVVDAFVARGRQLQQYSGPLAQANAQAQIRDVMADIREAQELGPDLARLTDLQSEWRQEMREILLPVKKAVTEALVNLLETSLQLWQGAKESLAEWSVRITEYVRAIAQFLTGHPIDARNTLASIDATVKAVLEALRKKPDDKDVLEEQLWALSSQLPFWGEKQFDPVLGVERGRLNGPRLGVP